jgi:hypothetical protein
MFNDYFFTILAKIVSIFLIFQILKNSTNIDFFIRLQTTPQVQPLMPIHFQVFPF